MSRVQIVVLMLAATVAFGSMNARADTIFGIYAGAGSWQQQYSGEVSAAGADIDIEDDLGIDDELNNVFYVAIEHPVPFVPNIRAAHAEIEVDSVNSLVSEVDFNGSTFLVGTDVTTRMNLTQSDATLYYELLDNWISADVGFSLRYVDGHVELTSPIESARADFEGVLPMLYGKARFDLPFTGGWVGAEVQGLSYDGNKMVDANVQLGWESPIGLGIEGGWRTYQLTLDDFDDFDSGTIDISGPYAALNFHF